MKPVHHEGSVLVSTRARGEETAQARRFCRHGEYDEHDAHDDNTAGNNFSMSIRLYNVICSCTPFYLI